MVWYYCGMDSDDRNNDKNIGNVTEETLWDKTKREAVEQEKGAMTEFWGGRTEGKNSNKAGKIGIITLVTGILLVVFSLWFLYDWGFSKRLYAGLGTAIIGVFVALPLAFLTLIVGTIGLKKESSVMTKRLSFVGLCCLFFAASIVNSFAINMGNSSSFIIMLIILLVVSGLVLWALVKSPPIVKGIMLAASVVLIGLVLIAAKFPWLVPWTSNNIWINL